MRQGSQTALLSDGEVFCGFLSTKLSKSEQRPEVYVEISMGHRAGIFIVGSDFFYDDLRGLRNALYLCLLRNRVEKQVREPTSLSGKDECNGEWVLKNSSLPLNIQNLRIQNA